MMSQGALFGPDEAPTSKPAGDAGQTMRVLITVKASPNPSEAYGETVCVAGIRLDLESPGWVRLYPINFRELDRPSRFRKYDVVSLRAKPARGDFRVESWRPDITSVRPEDHLRPWRLRRQHIEPYVHTSMCAVQRAVVADPHAPSLAAIRPLRVTGVDIEHHPGWTPDEQRKLDNYASQLELEGADRTVLQAPRFKAWYCYRCDMDCRGHRQGILDWEFVALQRNLARLSEGDQVKALRKRYFEDMCGSRRDTVFYVGNQRKSPRTFSVVGVFWPPR
jgi:hypothetical protein